MVGDASSWSRALVKISPYTFFAVGIVVAIGVSVLGAACLITAMEWRWCCVILVLLFSPFMASSHSVIKRLPGYPGDLPFKLESGYIGVGEKEDVQLFYLFVESQRSPSKDPLLLWFVGGPGCSGLSAFLFENGPLTFDRNYSGSFPRLILNPYAWSKVLNVIYMDIPVGTGFSYSRTQEGYHSSDKLWVEHGYDFLKKWFIDHSEFASNPFYIGGGSYSAFPSAPLVKKVYDGYEARTKPIINIKGFVLASPSADMFLDVNMQVVYAHQMSLISDELYESIKASCNGDYVNISPSNTKCVSDFEAYSRLVRYINVNQILEPVCITTPKDNARVLSEDPSEGILQSFQKVSGFWCRGYDHILVNQWANSEDVRKALQIREGTKAEFLRCNQSLSYTNYLLSVVDYHHNLTDTNLQYLIYCADLDMSIPQISTRSWVKSLNLTIDDPWRAWFVDGQVAGYTQIYKKHNFFLTYVAVKGAGHVAQSYKPKEVFQMIDRAIGYRYSVKSASHHSLSSRSQDTQPSDRAPWLGSQLGVGKPASSNLKPNQATPELHIGLEVHQPVIPPLSRARGYRCSVKPASRRSLSSRSQDTRPFGRAPWLGSRLGVGKPASNNFKPNQATLQHLNRVPPL
ncbi:serine carboxypeptidase-like 13 isoform X2 [Senna tora]|uniref:Serine carboxypeptidase-like 13 isoform X2 n=1 Tax=Senna tora TaxID=362788 RepID=A0A834T5Q7_9FABA|nr:serine carboxypeptidase-like 13 isoform X2 [Senna tora]